MPWWRPQCVNSAVHEQLLRAGLQYCQLSCVATKASNSRTVRTLDCTLVALALFVSKACALHLPA